MDPADLRLAAHEWVKEFALALKNVGLYSTEHPRGKESIARSYEKLKRLLHGRLSVTLARAEGRLTLEGIPIDRDRVVAGQLYSELDARGVHNVGFVAGVTQEEYTNLIRCLILKPERIHERGGLDLVLLDEGVSSITANKGRVGKVPEAMDLLTDLSLMDLIAGRAAALGGETVSSLLGKDPGGLARALGEAAARRDRSPEGKDLDFQSEQLADSLERLAERAIEEKTRDRPAVLADLARVLAATPPDIQSRILGEKVGPRSPRRNLTAAVEAIPADALAEVVTGLAGRGDAEFDAIQGFLDRTAIWRGDRAAALRAVEERLRARGRPPEEYGDLVDHLMWAELDVARRLQLLYQRDYLWTVDFQRVKEVLVKLFATDQIKEATALIQKYLSGLLVDDAAARRRVADNARYILHLIEKTGKGAAMLGRIADLFLARIQDETDPEVHARVAAALAFLADLRLRNGETGPVLDLMRRAESLAGSGDPAVRDRGERLSAALSRVGNDKLFKELTDRHLGGTDMVSVEAAEILKRAGGRAASFLIDRLAEEEDRGHRARLVNLLKEMNRSSSLPFTARLKDPRWYLVRNVVHILGEIGDASAMPALRETARHEDPRVRKELVRTFMRLGTPECEDHIVESVLDLDRSVQVAAVNSLSVLRGKRSAGIILDIIRRAPPYAGVDPEVREEAIHASGRMGLGEAVDLLVEIVTRKGFIGYAEPSDTRVAAVQALAAIGGDAALEILRELAKSDGKREVREAAQAALGSFGVGAE
jgi:HEAT repeat protein